MKQLKNPLKFEGIGVMYIYDLKQLKVAFKLLNLNYPRDEKAEPLSTRDISSKELVEHIEFIFKIAYENGYKFEVIELEWKRILNENNYTNTKMD